MGKKRFTDDFCRLFGLGRTENINPLTEESVRWVHAMADESCDPQTRERLLREAVDRQSRLRLDATVGLGCDRHLLGLACAARELGMDLPGVFTDKVCRAFSPFTDTFALLNVVLIYGIVRARLEPLIAS